MASRTQWAAAAVVLAAVACGAPCREAVAKEEASKSTAKPAKSIDEQIIFSNAIENGRIPEVGALLAQGFSVNDAQAYGFNAGDSPLMKAAQQGNAQLVAFLLRRGARVGYRNPRDGETALFRAAKFAGGGGTTDRYTIDVYSAAGKFLRTTTDHDVQKQSTIGHAVERGCQPCIICWRCGAGTNGNEKLQLFRMRGQIGRENK